jgi:hypothetical protein
MGDLQSEKEKLASFLLSHYKINSSPGYEGLNLNPKDVPPLELERMVNKFVYHQDLNGTHWVALEGNVVKINRFKPQKKDKKNKHPVAPTKISHGW